MNRLLIRILILAGYFLSGTAIPSEFQVVASRVGGANPPETLTVESVILGEQRQIYVQLPVGYDLSDDRYPVLFAMDGEWLFDLASAHARYYSFDEVTDETMPRMIIVGVPNTDRDKNYTPTPNSGNELEFPTAGSADVFLEFLERELVPMLERRYRTEPARTIVGWSFSGLFCAYAAVEKPELFNAHLCISPAVWWDNDLVYEKMKDARFDLPKRMVLTLGSGESGGLVYESSKRLLKLMQENPSIGISVGHFEIADVGHTWGVAAAMDKGLQNLFSGYIAPQSVINGGIASIDNYYERLSDLWGYSVRPPNKVLHAASYQEWQAGNHDAAIAILVAARTNDPNYSSTQKLLGMFYEAAGDAENALHAYSGAIRVEQKKPVPNEVNLRDYRARRAALLN